MKIELKLTEDSSTLYPSDSLRIENSKKYVYLEITGYDRKIAVNKEDLKKIVSIL